MSARLFRTDSGYVYAGADLTPEAAAEVAVRLDRALHGGPLVLREAFEYIDLRDRDEDRVDDLEDQLDETRRLADRGLIALGALAGASCGVLFMAMLAYFWGVA